MKQKEDDKNSIVYLLKKYEEIISYLFWGGMTTIVSWGSYSIVVVLLGSSSVWNGEIRLLHIKMPLLVLIANIISWICAMLFAFVTNKLWVFKSRSWKTSIVIPEFGKFLSARLVTGIMEIILVPVLVGIGLNQTILGVEGMVAKILVSVLVVILNYIFSKLFIFHGKLE